jgi:hypothetical protein
MICFKDMTFCSAVCENMSELFPVSWDALFIVKDKNL